MNKIFGFARKRNGQVLIIAALAMVFIMGSAALVIDVGLVMVEKSELQNAADSAAMAAVLDLPNASTAIDTAIRFAEANGIDRNDITVITPYNGDSKKIKVVCKDTVVYTFAKVLGFTDTEVTVSAVAKKAPWDGDALPFINLDDDYLDDNEIVAWEKVLPGDFESIDNYEMMYPSDPDLVYFKVDYMNGVELKKGTVATVKQEVGYIYDRSLGTTVHVLSLSSSVINSGKVLLTDGSITNLVNLKNDDVVDPSQLALLECVFHDYDYKGKSLFLTVVDSYDIASGEFPPDYVRVDGGDSMLID